MNRVSFKENEKLSCIWALLKGNIITNAHKTKQNLSIVIYKTYYYIVHTLTNGNGAHYSSTVEYFEYVVGKF